MYGHGGPSRDISTGTTGLPLQKCRLQKYDTTGHKDVKNHTQTNIKAHLLLVVRSHRELAQKHEELVNAKEGKTQVELCTVPNIVTCILYIQCMLLSGI